MHSAYDAPLFGERTKQQRMLIWATAIFVCVFIAFSDAVGLAFAFIDSNPNHIVLVLLTLCLLGLLGVLWKWYNDKEDRLSPKFRWLIIAMVVTVILSGIAVQVYAWDHPYVYHAPDPTTCVSKVWYGPDSDSDTCMGVSQYNFCKYPYCLFWESNTSGCCGNCSLGLEYCINGY